MIIDLVLYFGTADSPEARDSVLRFRKTAGVMRECVWGVGWDDCRVNPTSDDAFGVEKGFEAAADKVGCCAANLLCIGFGDLTGGSNSKGMLYSLPSFGRRDSVEPLFLSERVVGRSSRSSSNRASSICRSAI